MDTQYIVAKLIGVKSEQIKGMAKTAGEFRLELEGVKIGLKQPMPLVDKGLLRVGRHLWSVTWDGKDGKAEQLTVAGT
jgi:hypothetical protein